MSDQVDILCVAAHPDDAELHCGGTLLVTAATGGTFAICDLTAGERGTRGTRETRAVETNEASRRMGLPAERRVNLGIPDGGISRTADHSERLVRTIRHFRPSILLIPSPDDRHPDHGDAHRLAREAWFNSGLRTIETSRDGVAQEAFRPGRLLHYDHAWEREPDVVVDISSTFTRKLEVLAAYGTQFRVPGQDVSEESDEPETFISGSGFMEYMIARMRRHGFSIGVEYGEAFHLSGGPVGLRDLRMLLD